MDANSTEVPHMPATDLEPETLTEQQLSTRNAIKTLLSNYGPYLSKSMISAHIASYGSQYRLDWQGELKALVRQGVVIYESRMDESTSRPYAVYRLASRKP